VARDEQLNVNRIKSEQRSLPTTGGVRPPASEGDGFFFNAGEQFRLTGDMQIAISGSTATKKRGP
jgi:hypothetical protein